MNDGKKDIYNKRPWVIKSYLEPFTKSYRLTLFILGPAIDTLTYSFKRDFNGEVQDWAVGMCFGAMYDMLGRCILFSA